MSDNYQTACTNIINAITRVVEDTDVKAFTRRFYEGMSLVDLQDLTPHLASDIARHIFQAGQERTPGSPTISIESPAFLKETFGRARTVVAIINDDKPFLVDSLSITFKRLGFDIYRVIHPQLWVKRDAAGAMLDSIDADDKSELCLSESFIYFELSPLPSGMNTSELASKLELTLQYVHHTVSDWRIMMAKAREASTHVVMASNVLEDEEIEEASDFFDWLLDNNFIFMGFVEYDFYDKKGNECFRPTKNTALGVFRIPESDLLHRGLASLPPEMHHFAVQSEPIEITKSNRHSIVHRDVLMDYVGVKRYNEHGKVIGQFRFLGLFTSAVYYQNTDEIPYIRRKVSEVMDIAGFVKSGHSGKALKATLEFFPRDELFQISTDDLLEISLGIVSLEERPDIRVFFRRDKFERFISCLVFMPRDRFNTFIRKEIALVLERHLEGSLNTFYSQLTDSSLARVNYIINTTPNHIPDINIDKLNQELRFIINYWVDALRDQLQDDHGDEESERYFREFGQAFPRSYINTTPVEAAVTDIDYLYQVVEQSMPAFHMYESNISHNWHLKMYGSADNTPLSDIMPMIENVGFKVRDVVPYDIMADFSGTSTPLVIRDFTLLPGNKAPQDFDAISTLVEDILLAAWQGDVENDVLNALGSTAALTARQIDVVRTYTRYARQVGLGYSDRYVAGVLCKHSAISALLVGLFEHRFDPQAHATMKERHSSIKSLYNDIMDALTHVSILPEDKILRFMADTIQATLRTNYYQLTDGGTPKSYISIKLESGSVPSLPLPHPFREIFVYSMDVEGIHLRSGEVARGGLRWSDRHEDFRTEVLGLMKAQVVKNTVIVPTGSKGGFVVKRAYDASDRDARLATGIACYKQFLCGLLDVTDNRTGDNITPPASVIRYDGDDPYLVVAADKGTATFSDIANGVAQSYGFWLDDAFASGGSVGYDHKAMGITARGAWVSVTRHLADIGINADSDDFTVAGIGDMSGDVFGNGMLLSQHIKLVAAFNHLHIFIDPTPDASVSYKERQRLFEVARGSWDTYDESLISKGGGVFSRDAKLVTLTPQMQKLLGITDKDLTPTALISAILKAPVDLLWNGGIGTYVKASTESHDEADDPGNNALRINGDELRCRVVGEGGNLGMTQPGRIEYARHGGHLNTDAIDNSAGVDCSDHEVNIKIAMRLIMESGALTLDERNVLLEKMTDDVSELVLEDNQQQNQALSIVEARAAESIELHTQFIRELERNGLLDRVVEDLPSDKQLNDLKADSLGLTRPELAVLLSYSKIALYRALSASQLVHSPLFEDDYVSYFPSAMQTPYHKQLMAHPLKHEIIGTCLTNEIVNRAGLTYIYGIQQDTGHEICNIVRAYVVIRDVFNLQPLWRDIEACASIIDADLCTELFADTIRFLERMTVWFLSNTVQPLDMESLTALYKKGVTNYIKNQKDIASQSVLDARDETIKSYINQSVPKALAASMADLDSFISACDIIMIAEHHPQSLPTVGTIYFELGARLQLGWLRIYVQNFTPTNQWERLAMRSAVNELYDEQRRLTTAVLTSNNDTNCTVAIDQWMEHNEGDIERFKRLMYDVKASEQSDLSVIIVALRQLTGIHPSDTDML